MSDIQESRNMVYMLKGMVGDLDEEEIDLYRQARKEIIEVIEKHGHYGAIAALIASSEKAIEIHEKEKE